MLEYKWHTIIFSILTNQIICDLLQEGNEDAKNTDRIDTLRKSLYEVYPRHIFVGATMQELRSRFPPDQTRLKHPLVSSIDFENFGGHEEIVLSTDFSSSYKNSGGNNNRDNALYFRYPSDIPAYRNRIEKPNSGYRKGPLPNFHYYILDSVGDKDIPSWMKPFYQMSVGSIENFRFPIPFLMSHLPEIRYIGPVLSSEMGNIHSDSMADSPDVEILKSIGFALPPEITTYYPRTYAKGYSIDVPSPSINKLQNHDTQSLLVGELEDDKEEDGEELTVGDYEINNPSHENDIPSYTRKRPSQYYYSNTKPITFEKTARHPENIYEIISAEKIIPKEMDMTVHLDGSQRSDTSWRPVIATEILAKDDDIVVKSTDQENSTVLRNEPSEGSGANEQVQSDLEDLLTGEAVGEDKDEEVNTTRIDGEAKKNLMMFSEVVMERDGDLMTEERLSVLPISESENTTNTII